MKLVPQSAPYIRKNVSVKRMMLDVIIALMPVTIFAIIQGFYNKGNEASALLTIIISLVTMVGVELIAHGLIHWPKGMKFKQLFTKDGFKNLKSQYTVNNLTAPIISALIYAMIMPACCDLFVVFIGALFGILIGKMVFGGLGSNIFNPAAVGRIFASICFGDALGKAYPLQSTYVDAAGGGTPLGFIKSTAGFNLANTGNYSILDLLIGNCPGAMGEVCAICILIGAAYLFIRRSADLRACLSYFLSFAIIMLVACISFRFGKDSVDTNVFEMWAYQLLSGGILFGAVFMITDPVTSPTSKTGRIIYGVLAGIITALIRVCGSYPEGVAFSILIGNLTAPAIDYFLRGTKNKYGWKSCLIVGISIAIACVIVSASVMGGWF